MNTLRNNVQLIGRLGDNVMVKQTSTGKSMARFSLATNETYYTESGEKKENTYWHNVVAWGKTANNIAEYTEKGKQIAIQGKLINRSYEADGQTKYVTEVQVNEFLMMD